MRTLVLDIETAALPWLDLDPIQRATITKGAEGGAAYRARKDFRSLSPYAAKVIVVSLLDPDSGNGRLLFESEQPMESDSADGLFDLFGGSEAAILEETWASLAKCDRVVTFNGRGFDGPFLSVRSAIHGLKPTRNLVGNRYNLREHVDLYEVLTFQGAMQARPSLHVACVSFGIPSPKVGDVSGAHVGEAFRQGRIAEILEYGRRDVEATAALFRKLESTLLPLFFL